METNNTLVIKPSKGLAGLKIRELIQYRGLLYFLVWRDIKVKYKQTLLGVAWAVLQPLLTMIVFTIFFGNMANMPSDGVPYPIFSYSGLLIWTYFATAVNFSSQSLVGNQQLVTKIYFPRILITMGATVAGLLDYVIALVILVVMMFWYQIVPSVELLLLPVVILFGFLTATGIGMWLSALNVKYRDVRYVVPFLVQLWLFLTPVIYPVSLFSESKYQWLLALNPMTGVVEAHRAVILGTTVELSTLGISAGVAVFLFISGLFYFKQMERSFADVI